MKLIKTILKSAAYTTVFLFGSVTFFLVYMLWDIKPDNTGETETAAIETPEEESAKRAGAYARLLCKMSIKANLNDPGSAEWGPWDAGYYGKWTTLNLGEIVTVRPSFRANNAYGALIVSTWVCVTEGDGDNRRVTELRQL